VEVTQHLVQPGPEVALAQFLVGLGRFLQPELAQREEAVGAAPQILVGTGGDGIHAQITDCP